MNMILPRVARSVLIFTLEMLEVGAKADAQWDEAAAEISPALDEAAQARLKKVFGLDQPLHIQYLLYIKNTVLLDWGRSFSSSRPVFDILIYRFWNTVFLMGAGMCFTLVGISETEVSLQ